MINPTTAADIHGIVKELIEGKSIPELYLDLGKLDTFLDKEIKKRDAKGIFTDSDAAYLFTSLYSYREIVKLINILEMKTTL